jgi:hypothetical protein
MDGIQYDVATVLKVEGLGQYKSHMAEATKASSAFETATSKIGSGAKEMFGGLASAAAATAGAIARAAMTITAGAVGAGAMALGAIGKNLSMLDDKSIELASVLSVATKQPFEQAQAASSDLFNKFRADAVKSAGETADFVDIAGKIAPAMLGANKSLEDLRLLTQGVIAAAKPLGVDFKQAGSDIQHMLQGQAGVDQPSFAKLNALMGDLIPKAEEFNKMSPEKRIEAVTKALRSEGFLAAADAAGNTFTGLASTFQDAMKTIGGLVAGPTLQLLNDQFRQLVGWLTGKLDASTLKNDLEAVGNAIAKRFGQVGQQLRRIFPSVGSDAESAFRTIAKWTDVGMGKLVDATKWVADHWGEITSAASRAADAIGRAASFAADLLKTIGGGDMVKGIERAAQAFVALQAAQLAAPVVSGAMAVGQGVAGASKAVAAGASMAGGLAGAGGTVAALGAVGAAIVGVGLAADQASKYLKESKGFLSPGAALKNDDFEAIRTAFDEFGHGKRDMGDQEMQTLRQKYVDLATSLGENSAVAGQFVDSMIAMRMDVFRQTNDFKATVDAAAANFDIYTIADVYNRAVANNNVAAAKYAAMALLSGDQSAKALEQAGHALVGGYEKFSDLLGDASGASMAKLKEFFEQGPAGPKGGTKDSKAKAPSAGGGQKVDVTIRWELGEGDADALIVRTRQSLIDSVKQARTTVRSVPRPGWGL